MKTITKSQLEDLMASVYEGGSDYWMDIPASEVRAVLIKYGAPGKLVSQCFAWYLFDGNELTIVDTADLSETLGTLSLEGINKAMNNPACSAYFESLVTEDYDEETTDIIIQYAIFNEIVYG
jgi:hypothetical protein